MNPPARQTISLAARLHTSAIRMLRGLRSADLAAGMGPARLSALSVLVFRGPATMGELAAAEQVSAPTMTRIVAGLEADGLVRRRPDAGDGRVTRVAATARGRRRMEAARARRLERLEAALCALAAEDRVALERATAILERLDLR